MSELNTLKDLMVAIFSAQGFWAIEDGKCPLWAKAVCSAYPEAIILKGNKSAKTLEPVKEALRAKGYPVFGSKDCSHPFYGERSLVVIPQSTLETWKSKEILPELTLFAQQKTQETVDF